MAGDENVPPNTMKRKYRVITRDIAETIDAARTYFEEEARAAKREKLTRPIDRTAACFGIHRTTVIAIRQKLERGETFDNGDKRERDMEVPASFAGVIRETIHDMCGAKEGVMLDFLLQKLTATRCTRTQGGNAMLWRFLTDKMGYSYVWKRYVQHCMRVEDKFIAAADTTPIEMEE